MPRAPGPSPRLTIPLALLAAPVLGACKVVPPPPLVAFHTTTENAPKGETTITLAIGLAMQGLGGSGIGGALRIEHQQYGRTGFGAEIALASVDAPASTGSGPGDQVYLFGARAYGKSAWANHDWVGATYGLGVTALSSGMVTLQLHAGAAVSDANSHFEPYLATSVAFSAPLVQGEPFGDMRERSSIVGPHTPENDEQVPPKHVGSTWFFIASGGFVVPVGDTGHAPSLELGIARPSGSADSFLSLSAADSYSTH